MGRPLRSEFWTRPWRLSNRDSDSNGTRLNLRQEKENQSTPRLLYNLCTSLSQGWGKWSEERDVGMKCFDSRGSGGSRGLKALTPDPLTPGSPPDLTAHVSRNKLCPVGLVGQVNSATWLKHPPTHDSLWVQHGVNQHWVGIWFDTC